MSSFMYYLSESKMFYVTSSMEGDWYHPEKLHMDVTFHFQIPIFKNTDKQTNKKGIIIRLFTVHQICDSKKLQTAQCLQWGFR